MTKYVGYEYGITVV